MEEKIKREYPFDLVTEIMRGKFEDIELDWIVENFDENINFLFEKNKSIFSDHEKEILFSYYKEGKSIAEIAKELDRSSEIIKRTLTKTVVKLRYPGIIKYIIYGKDVEEKIKDLRKNKKYYVENYNRILANMSEEDIDKLIIEDCKMNDKFEENPIEYLDLPLDCYNILKGNGINYIKHLIAYKKEDLMGFKNFTETDYSNLIEAINNNIELLPEEFKAWVSEK